MKVSKMDCLYLWQEFGHSNSMILLSVLFKITLSYRFLITNFTRMSGINTSTSSYRFSKHQNLLIQGELCPNQHKSHPTMSKYQEHFYSPIPSTRKLSTLLLPIPAKYQSALRRLERYLNTTGKLQLRPNQIPILKSL